MRERFRHRVFPYKNGGLPRIAHAKSRTGIGIGDRDGVRRKYFRLLQKQINILMRGQNGGVETARMVRDDVERLRANGAGRAEDGDFFHQNHLKNVRTPSRSGMTKSRLSKRSIIPP